ncbi:malto-oligosyltrehalose synthase [Achromobacter marplatensis]|uniref:Maltooligosyl trehalose synthase n=1 Tax=Achromobacter marplatensis TaxID=470868 RepID=A0ABX9GIG3_9BURK|nr:malto-oligosyltrehalose synthase [Achromobacter marplatensis]OWT72548.1 malto-oligosyltrehalose synthase [Achromobacter marplatensis]RBP24145.1 maltooligosyl trehalose synthase [Achromobacter marplatensis]CAB3628133.1 Maltooligosyl trehalose synthase [Achromobacter marplatensis]
MNAPRATARLQLHAGFTLDDARAQLPYYAALGVSHLYLSPITQARDGSTHGYDVTDHQRVSAALGGDAALRRLAAAARDLGLGLIADIVPNHMAAHPSNAWWADVLRLGQRSPHARVFDIDWDAPDPALRGKVLLPVLPDPYGVCLASGAIQIVHDADAFFVSVSELRLPLAPGFAMDAAGPDATCAAHNAQTAEGRARLHDLLERQHYRLAWWRTAPEQINWRRFFEISELVGVRVEDDIVFDAVHGMALRLYREGVLDGLRIDHVDGLASPGAYLRRLRQRLTQARGERASAYLVVEKILADGETLDFRWPTDGTTGYDFMDQVGALLHAPAAQAPLEAYWNGLAGDPRGASAQLQDARQRMLARHFPAERQALARALARVARMDLRTRDWTTTAIDRVLTALLAVFPVYRTYAEDGGRSPADTDWFHTALDRARTALGPGTADARLLDQIGHWLSGAPVDESLASHGVSAPEPHALAEALAHALRRFQQLTPPLAAKALEDTLFYRRGPLLSRNEVGSSAERFSLSPDAFHALSAERAATHPHAMLATATHDHKRGEDTRARLAVLSEAPDEWIALAQAWVPRLARPGPIASADAYLLLQSLVGAWPLALPPEPAGDALADYLARIAQWQEKALREAKLRTSWTDPDAAYEQSAARCLDALKHTDDGRLLLREIADYTLRLAPAGLVNGLAQTLLRCTLPGVPDLYQGADLWDFSLVDPDNRRPVDYPARADLLALDDPGQPIVTNAAAWHRGAIKQALIRRALALRARDPALFSDGRCEPLAVHGPQAAHVLAYLRRHETRCLLVVVPRLCARALAPYAQGQAAQAHRFWDGSRIRLPSDVPAAGLVDTLSGRQPGVDTAGDIDVADLLRDCPVALCVAG